jgi:hypothetical protein
VILRGCAAFPLTPGPSPRSGARGERFFWSQTPQRRHFFWSPNPR